MSIHLAAKHGEIAESVLLPGDPLRAKFIAENYLENAQMYNEVRGMYGFTGFYKGNRVSVQGTGMGVPSISIYAHELMVDYGVRRLIRVGTAGALHADMKVRDIVLAMSASTDSAVPSLRLPGVHYAATADFALLEQAYHVAERIGRKYWVGNIFTSDTFYHEDESIYQRLQNYGVLAVEMETAALYTLAARYGRRALSILTISDHILTGDTTTSEERQTSFRDMMEIALEAMIVEEG
ncbi:purine-nucleoside phosphorylase [Alicyclobacillus tolerans]|uniref:Purine nucleoside phosphorylase DeoD-type n=1 Tax=Alicyclobacillus tolerans TaxID=90970 RepID=A0ABT9LY36_9BACL|nr:purine-nucleoside phosphorylase [Alicyclobacillus tengchongensis]MDP9729181.1 purine-nucleoside phosphorylase [Alicyclobacillus tengchongensis]